MTFNFKHVMALGGVTLAGAAFAARLWSGASSAAGSRHGLCREMDVHNYIHELESGMPYEAYLKKFTRVTQAAYLRMEEDFGKAKLLHSQFASMAMEEVSLLLAAAIAWHNDHDGYGRLFTKQRFFYDVGTGRYVIDNRKVTVDREKPAFNVQDLKDEVKYIQSIMAESPEHSLVVVMIRNREYLDKHLKDRQSTN